MMLRLENVSPEQVSLLLGILRDAALPRADLVRAKYARVAQFFDETFTFLEDLGLVRTQEGRFVVGSACERYMARSKMSSVSTELARQLVLECLARQDAPFSESLAEFLSHFELKNEQYEFQPSSSQRRSYGDVRNLLMRFGLIVLRTDQSTYVVTSKHADVYLALTRTAKLPPEKLAERQKRQEELGNKAELAVLGAERRRLSEYPELVAAIRHVAAEDAAAGYDIRSYELPGESSSAPRPRYIEVKAVSAWNHRFFWTRNEIQKSKTLGDSYYLYLVPAMGGNRFDMSSVEVIRSPHEVVCNEHGEWVSTVELMSFSLAEAGDPKRRSHTRKGG
jgi:hypothetical protein